MEDFPKGTREVIAVISFGTTRVHYHHVIRELVSDLDDDRCAELFPLICTAINTAVLETLNENVIQKISYKSTFQVIMGDYEHTIKKSYMLYPVNSYIQKLFLKLLERVDETFPAVCYANAAWAAFPNKKAQKKYCDVTVKVSLKSHGKKSLKETIDKRIQVAGNIREAFEERVKALNRDLLS